jgi:outer membrane protein assembly factor BamB
MRLAAGLSAVLLSAAGVAAPVERDWPQWGGPSRDFSVEDPGLVEAWPAEGPRRLWTQPLGDGFSAIVGTAAAAYAVYREGADDVTVALRPATGERLWERRVTAPFKETCSFRLGAVPRATPLVSGRLLFVLSAGGKLTAFDREAGELVWQRELLAEHPEAARACGFSSSPLAFGDTLVVQTGAPGAALVALRQRDGSVVWRRHDFANGYASPILVSAQGRRQLVAFMAREIVGVEPLQGDLLWRHPHPTESDVNASTPVWSDGLLFVSSGYDGGSRVVRVPGQGGAASVEEVWAHKRMRVHFGTALRIGDVVYGSNGDFGPAPFTAVDLRSGQVLWRDRAVGRASGIVVGGRMLLLDEEGVLALATPTAEGLRVHARAQVLAREAWTPPTLVGTTLLVRDRRTIAAYDLARR